MNLHESALIHSNFIKTLFLHSRCYSALRLLTSIKLQIVLQCQPKTHSVHFRLEHLCLFYYCHHSSTARRGVLIESLMRYYLFIFHKHLPLHSSFPSNSVSLGLRLWHCQSVGVIPQKAGKESEVQGWGAVVISHLMVHYMECWPCLSGRGGHTHTTPRFPILQGQLSLSSSDACVGSCIVTLNLLIPPRWLMGIPHTKRHSTWVDWSITMYTPFAQWLPEACMLTPP